MKLLPALLVVGTVALAAPHAASAQQPFAALVKVPFDFIVGDLQLPRGSYRIAADTHDPAMLFITNTGDTALAALVVARSAGPAGPDARLEFKSVSGRMFLWQVGIPGGSVRDIAVTKAEAERTLARLDSRAVERAHRVR